MDRFTRPGMQKSARVDFAIVFAFYIAGGRLARFSLFVSLWWQGRYHNERLLPNNAQDLVPPEAGEDKMLWFHGDDKLDAVITGLRCDFAPMGALGIYSSCALSCCVFVRLSVYLPAALCIIPCSLGQCAPFVCMWYLPGIHERGSNLLICELVF